MKKTDDTENMEAFIEMKRSSLPKKHMLIYFTPVSIDVSHTVF